MSTLSPTPDNSPPCSDPHVDGCPECVVNCEPARVHVEHDKHCAADYQCTDCGHEWSTTWGGR